MRLPNKMKTLKEYIALVEGDSVLTHAGFRDSADILDKHDFLNKRDTLIKVLADEKDPENRKHLKQEIISLEKLYPQYEGATNED